jgi:hypothetical protein
LRDHAPLIFEASSPLTLGEHSLPKFNECSLLSKCPSPSPGPLMEKIVSQIAIFSRKNHL